MTKEKRKNRLQVMLSDSQLDDVLKLSLMEGRSTSGMLRRLIDHALNTYEREV